MLSLNHGKRRSFRKVLPRAVTLAPPGLEAAPLRAQHHHAFGFCGHGRVRSACAGKIVRNPWTRNKVPPLTTVPGRISLTGALTQREPRHFLLWARCRQGGTPRHVGNGRARYFVMTVDGCIMKGDSIHVGLSWTHHNDRPFQPLLHIKEGAGFLSTLAAHWSV